MPKEYIPTASETQYIVTAVHRFRDKEKREPTLLEIAKNSPFTNQYARMLINKLVKQGVIHQVLTTSKEVFVVTEKKHKSLNEQL